MLAITTLGTCCCCSVAQSYLSLCDPMDSALQASLSITISQRLLNVLWTVMPSNHFVLCHPLLLLPSVFSSIRVFSNESVLNIRWPKYWSFSFSITPSNDFLWDQLVGSPCCLRDSQESSPIPQFKTSTLWCSAVFMVQVSYPYMTTGKTTALTRWTFVTKAVSLLF